MKLELPHPPGTTLADQIEATRRFGNYLAISFAIIALWLVVPSDAWAQSTGTAFEFPVLDQMLCGFIAYSKSRLAPYIAVLTIIIGVIGHWLGATKVWGTLLYVVLGLGIIMGIGAAIVRATNAGATCL
ncbi:MAG: hypothetical protein HYX47_13270 [Burkholderiales bacterium]|nr:hypothetical protein [Burkholderiales bacterium]